MAFLPRCRTDIVYIIVYFVNEAGMISILRASDYPLGLKMVPAPLINMETQIISYLIDHTSTDIKPEDIYVHGEFFEASKDALPTAATFYLAKSSVPLVWHDDIYYTENFMSGIKNAPATRERATYLKALQIISGMHLEMIKAVEDLFVTPKA